MVSCAQTFAPTSEMDEAGARCRGRGEGRGGSDRVCSGMAEGSEHEKVAIFGHG